MSILSAKFTSADQEEIRVITSTDDGCETAVLKKGSKNFDSFLKENTVRPWVSTFDAALIMMEHDRRMHAALQGRDASMLREAIYLQNIVMLGGTLTDDQKISADMFRAINMWETAMIEMREALIVDEDAASAVLDATWPAPPDGLPDFLDGF